MIQTISEFPEDVGLWKQDHLDKFIDLYGASANIKRLIKASTSLEECYNAFLKSPGDIDLDMPFLRMYGEQCLTITEMGVRAGYSTAAFLAAVPHRLRSYDIAPCPTLRVFKHVASSLTDFQFIQADVLTIDIEPCELLFIDTLHTYTQLTQELNRHADKVSKYIGFHDVLSFGERGEDGSEPGLMKAITDFMARNDKWAPDMISYKQNGVMFLRRLS